MRRDRMCSGWRQWVGGLRILRAARLGLIACVAACTAAPRSPPAAAPSAAPSAVSAPKQSSDLAVELIAFNDFHGYLQAPTGAVAGGAPLLGAWIRRWAAAHPLHAVVAAGDLVGASPLVSAYFHDEPTIALLNRMGLEFSAVGNHEFDHGAAELLRLQNGGCADDARSCAEGPYTGATFRYLAANVRRLDGSPFLPAYAIKRFRLADGHELRVGFIGAVLRQTPAMVNPAGVSTLRFDDEADAINTAAAELRAQGVRTSVVLIHQGVATAAAEGDRVSECPAPSGALLPILARLDPELRVVISGHTHRSYVCHMPTAGGERWYTSAGSEGRYLTAIDLRLSETGELRTVQARNQAVVAALGDAPSDGIGSDGGTAGSTPGAVLAPAADLAAAVAADLQRIAPLQQRRIATLRAAFTRQATEAGESALGDLVADAQQAAARRWGAVLALTNPGGLRGDLRGDAQGAVTYGDVFAAQPFGNRLIVLRLSGAQLYAVLEQQFRGAAPPRVLQVSSAVRYRWRSTADGAHLVPGSLRLQGVAVVAGRSYRLVVNEYLARGGDGFSVFSASKDWIDSGIIDADALSSYLQAHDPLQLPAFVRIARDS